MAKEKENAEEEKEEPRNFIFATPDLIKGVLVDSCHVGISEDHIIFDAMLASLSPENGGMKEIDVIVSRMFFRPKVLLILKKAIDKAIKDYEKEYKTKIKTEKIEIARLY